MLPHTDYTLQFLWNFQNSSNAGFQRINQTLQERSLALLFFKISGSSSVLQEFQTSVQDQTAQLPCENVEYF